MSVAGRVSNDGGIMRLMTMARFGKSCSKRHPASLDLE
jgi:hypothetical protein